MSFKNNIDFRKKTLTKLLHSIILHENDIVEALHKDFKKPPFESVITETSYVISDLRNTISNLKSWTKPKKVFPSLLNFPSSDSIYSEPYGSVLIISPWNFPFQLALSPLIAAVAAGNSVVLKPSELTPATATIISKIIRETFDAKHVVAILGDASMATELLKKRWDYIFFTGSIKVGKIIAKAAAENLTPVTLELGGKSPCIIDETANIPLAAKRIVWGKFVNAGQTCIAPDYVLAHSSIRSYLIGCLKEEITNAYGEDPALSPDFARIINNDNWKRLNSMIESHKVVFGGISNEEERYISPTIIEEINMDSELMKDEIFGPLLPVCTYTHQEDIRKIISKYEKPLSLYLFTENEDFSKKIMEEYSFGGGCINDTLIHFSNKRLPFGGVGYSGSGAYHGKYGFDTFSHKKAIVKKANWLDIPLRYAPYKNKFSTVKRLLKWF